MRLIDADALEKVYVRNSITDTVTVGEKSVLRHLREAPTIDAVPVVREWIPVTERLPEKEGYYLVAHQRSGCVAEAFYHRDYPDLFVEGTGDPVAYWMPLPEPPKEVE